MVCIFVWSVWKNSLTIHPSLVEEAKEATRSSMLIYVKMMTGKTIELKVIWSGTIEQVKQKIEDLENVPIHRQFLIFADKELHNYQTLSYYNIQKKVYITSKIY